MQYLQVWKLAGKQARVNIEVPKIILTVYKIDKFLSTVRVLDIVYLRVQNCNNDNCKGNPLIVLVIGSPTTKK